jgi:hypothetical protein
MDFHSKIVLVAMLFFLTLALNLPFGYARKKTRKFSFKWFAYIHIPIPFIFLARVLSHIEFRYVPFFVVAAVIGQVLGGRLGS